VQKCSFCNVGYVGYPNCNCSRCGAGCQIGFGSASTDGAGNTVYKSCSDNLGKDCILGRVKEHFHECKSIHEFLYFLLEKAKENSLVEVRNNTLRRYLEVVDLKKDGIFITSLAHRHIAQCQNTSQ